MRILIINGPNLNMLGHRDPKVYGKDTLKDLEKKCSAHAAKKGLKVSFFQSNHEGELIDKVQSCIKGVDGLIINPGGYSHTSIALMDALEILKIPVIEVHLSDIKKREKFRKHSYVSLVADKVICGQGGKGYLLALDALSVIPAKAGIHRAKK